MKYRLYHSKYKVHFHSPTRFTVNSKVVEKNGSLYIYDTDKEGIYKVEAKAGFVHLWENKVKMESGFIRLTIEEECWYAEVITSGHELLELESKYCCL